MKKNYKEIFEKSNKDLIKKAKIKNALAGFLMIIVIPMIILITILLISFHEYSAIIIAFMSDNITIYKGLFVFLAIAFIMLCVFFSGYVQKMYTKELQKHANELALGMYIHDMILALNRKFTCTSGTKTHLQNIISNYPWLDYRTFSFDPEGIELDEPEDEYPTFAHHGYTFELIEWQYKDDQFAFIFDVTDHSGQTKKRKKIYLPSYNEEDI